MGLVSDKTYTGLVVAGNRDATARSLVFSVVGYKKNKGLQF